MGTRTQAIAIVSMLPLISPTHVRLLLILYANENGKKLDDNHNLRVVGVQTVYMTKVYTPNQTKNMNFKGDHLCNYTHSLLSP